MPSRKQRRKRQKEKRHEYEYVFVDEHGREVEVDEETVASANGTRAHAKERAKAPQPRGGRAGRTVEPASWQRAARRGLLFSPFMFGVLYLMERDRPLIALAANTVILLGFFIPFGYLMDRVMYRSFARRTGKPAEPRAKKRG